MTRTRFTAAELRDAAKVATEARVVIRLERGEAAVLGHTSARTMPIYTAQVRQMERAKQAQEKRK